MVVGLGRKLGWWRQLIFLVMSLTKVILSVTQFEEPDGFRAYWTPPLGPPWATDRVKNPVYLSRLYPDRGSAEKAARRWLAKNVGFVEVSKPTAASPDP